MIHYKKMYRLIKFFLYFTLIRKNKHVYTAMTKQISIIINVIQIQQTKQVALAFVIKTADGCVQQI